jgi:hypothetical protein
MPIEEMKMKCIQLESSENDTDDQIIDYNADIAKTTAFG